MSNTVYLFGAGINKDVKGWNGLNPPLSTDFFQGALRHPRLGNDHYKEKLGPVFDYIARYWKLSPEDLESEGFDLESCFTLIELQKEESRTANDRDLFLHLNEIDFLITAMLAEYLEEFEHFAHSSDSFMALGKVIHAERSAVLTFNYDTILESAIESASGVRGSIPSSFHGRPPDTGAIPDEELPYSHFNWNRPLAYGVKFDEVQLHRAGLSSSASGERFYSHPSNLLYSPPFLKLHGSINWFIYTGIKKYPYLNDAVAEGMKDKSLIYRPTWWFNDQPDYHGVIIAPIIVTPVINKQIYGFPIIPTIWQRAKEELLGCHRLVVGGYSFPPTDFHTRRLFLESFSKHSLEELIVINPDTRIVQLVKDLCHFERPVLACRDLDEFMTLYKVG